MQKNSLLSRFTTPVMTQHVASFDRKRNDARNQASAIDVLPVEPTFSRTW